MHKTLVLVGPALCPPKYHVLREVGHIYKLACLCDNIIQNPLTNVFRQPLRGSLLPQEAFLNIPHVCACLTSQLPPVPTAPLYPRFYRAIGSERTVALTYCTLQSVEKCPVAHVWMNQAKLLHLSEICSQL